MCNLYHVSPKGDFVTYIARHAERWMVPDYELRTVGPNQDGVFFARPAPRLWARSGSGE